MIESKKIVALRVERQHLVRKANETVYIDLYRDLQPGLNVFWSGFGDPPSLTHRANFDDIEFNRIRQRVRALAKGRFCGGNLGWIMAEDMELFACLFRKPLDKPNQSQLDLLELIEREGPLTIQQMKESFGMLVKEITPILHRLQEAFLVYEDQYDGEWDRGWYKFSEMFPDVDLTRYSHLEALKILLKRFAYRQVLFDAEMVKSYYKLPTKEITAALNALVEENVLIKENDGYLLRTDYDLLATSSGEVPQAVYALHRNDFLVRVNAHILKDKYPHPYPNMLYYLLVDGEIKGAVAGKFHYTWIDVEDVMLDLPEAESSARKDEIFQAIYAMCGENNRIKRYLGLSVSGDE